MGDMTYVSDTKRYARCIEASKRIRWDIDRDVIRGRPASSIFSGKRRSAW